MKKKMKCSKMMRHICSFFPVVLSVILSMPLDASAWKMGAHQVTAQDVAYSLPFEAGIIREAMIEYPYIRNWAADGPDIPYGQIGVVMGFAPWADRFHYDKVGTFAKTMLQKALSWPGDEQTKKKMIAFASGWVTHLTGDLAVHGIFVNPEVNGIFLSDPNTKIPHGTLEVLSDVFIFNPFWGSDENLGSGVIDQKRSYSQSSLHALFPHLTSDDIAAIAVLLDASSLEVYGDIVSVPKLMDWMDFTKQIIDTGIGGPPGVPNLYPELGGKSYDEVKNMWASEVVNYNDGTSMTRIERNGIAYKEGKNHAIRLLADAAQGNYCGFKDTWNLDAGENYQGAIVLRIQTADEEYAGTDDNVYFGMTFTNGLVWEKQVDNPDQPPFADDFERGTNIDYYFIIDNQLYDLNQIQSIYLRKDPGPEPCAKDEYCFDPFNPCTCDAMKLNNHAWKIGYFTAWTNGMPIFSGAVNTWLNYANTAWSASRDQLNLACVLDRTPPVTTATLSPVPNQYAWNNTDVTVLLTAQDDPCGCVEKIEYSAVGAHPIPSTVMTENPASIVINTDGETNITFSARDNWNNYENSQTITVKLDKNPPTITATRNPAPNRFGWNNTDVTVNLTCMDAVSGVLNCGPTPQVISAEGAGQSVTATTMDYAGNSASLTVDNINIDKTPPSISCSVNPNKIWSPDHKMKNITATVLASDSLSGLDGHKLINATSNEPDNGLGDGDMPNDIQGWVIGSADLFGKLRAERSGSGTGRVYTLLYKAYDLADNEAACATTVKVPLSQTK